MHIGARISNVNRQQERNEYFQVNYFFTRVSFSIFGRPEQPTDLLGSSRTLLSYLI